MRVKKWAVLAACTAGLVGVGAGYAGTTPQRTGSGAQAQNGQLADLLASRSPGQRGAAAVSNKQPVFKQAAWTPTYPAPSALSERTPAVQKVASAAPVIVETPVPATAIAPAVLAPTPVPVTATAPIALGAAPVAVAAATGGSSLGAAALLPAIPLIFAAGGGGGGGTASFNLAPAVPEPSTWMMMISGFGMLGFALRRRRRQLRQSQLVGAGDVRLAGQHC